MFNLSVFDFERHDVAGEAFSNGNIISVEAMGEHIQNNLNHNVSRWSFGYIGTSLVSGCGMTVVCDKLL